MGLKQTFIHVNSETGKLIDPTSGNSARADLRPLFIHGMLGVLCVQFWYFNTTTGLLTVTPIGATDTLDMSFDMDMVHELDDGILEDAITLGVPVTAIRVSALTEVPATVGYLTLYNGSSNDETVEYTSWTVNAGVYTFVVSKTFTYSYAEHDECDISDTLMVHSKTDQVDVAGDWTDINRTTGKVSIRYNCRTTPFKNGIGTGTAIQNGFIQINKYVVGETGATPMCLDDARCRGAVYLNEGTNLADDTNVYTKAELDNLLAAYVPLKSGTQQTLTDNSANYITIGTVATIRGAGVIVTIKKSTGLQINDFLIVHDGSTAEISRRYAQVGTEITGVVWTADISSGDLRLVATLSGVGSNLIAVCKISSISIDV